MPRGRHPKRKKREGEVWHKHKGPHKKSEIYLLCMRCKRGISFSRIRVHVRLCFGIQRCLACDYPFPCESKVCPWRFPDLPRIPSHLVPYFRRNPRAELPPDVMAIERTAVRWMRNLLKRQAWSER